jgi:hypothetical protein
MTNKQKNYEIGYRDGMAGKPFKTERSKFTGYSDGWQDGNSAVPILDYDTTSEEQKEANRQAINAGVAESLRLQSESLRWEAKSLRRQSWSSLLEVISALFGR